MGGWECGWDSVVYGRGESAVGHWLLYTARGWVAAWSILFHQTTVISHDSSMGERLYLTICPPCGLGSIPDRGGVFQEIFPWLITFCQPVLSQCCRKWLNLFSMAPHSLWISRRKAEVQPWTQNSRRKENSLNMWGALLKNDCSSKYLKSIADHTPPHCFVRSYPPPTASIDHTPPPPTALIS